ncbi:survival of motor neuron-related-splicing factor 30 [Entomortierella parvispora]|uniref:Survival of motor neuron-related-splicing factor 30 n=1 Tax=Entomortierella parvispora TaxID=205924 RepID=A0A9P3LZ21_9FUNG|nr:survival of motor neuron-related-splicing factor 30 [Entomortierella parvispora]
MSSSATGRETPSNFQLLDMAREVLLVCCDKSLGDILTDLAMTRSSEITINRIFDGQFLSPMEPPAIPRALPPEERVVDLISSSEDEDPIKDEFAPRHLQKSKPESSNTNFNLEDVLGTRVHGDKTPQAVKREDSWPAEAEPLYDNMNDYEPWRDNSPLRAGSPLRETEWEPATIDLQFNPRKKWEKPSKKIAVGSLSVQDPLDDWDFDVPAPAQKPEILDQFSKQTTKPAKSTSLPAVTTTKSYSLDWSDDDLNSAQTSQRSPSPALKRRSPSPIDLLATTSDTGRYRETTSDRPRSTLGSPNWNDIANSSLSPPTQFQDDTDSEQEMLMQDVFSGNPKRKGAKNSRSGSRLNQVKKRPRAVTPDLNEWDTDDGNSGSGSLQDEIARRSRRSRTIDDDTSIDAKEAKEVKRREKEAAAAEKKAKKEAEQQHKREKKERERVAKEEERLAEKKAARDMRIANRLTTKAEGVKEMILCMDEILLETGFGSAARDYLGAVDCQIQRQRTASGGDIGGTATEKSVIFWRRTVTSRFDEDQEIFVPLNRDTPEIDLEPFALIYVSGSDFAAMIEHDRLRPGLASLKRDLGIRINKERMKQSREFPERSTRLLEKQKQRVIYLIDGLEAHLRSLKKVTTKKFQQAVLASLGHQQAGSQNVMDQASVVDEERIEQELLWLQLEQDCLVMHAENEEESAQILVSLTEQIGLRPYKESRKSKLNVCVEGIKSGTDPSDTWHKSLQEIRMVTAAVAKSIVEEYPTIKSLYEGYRKCTTRQEAEQMLERIENDPTTRRPGPNERRTSLQPLHPIPSNIESAMDSSELDTYKEQVAAINDALQADPENSELLSIKTELLELISLTEALLQQEQSSAAPSPATAASSTVTATSTTTKATTVTSATSSPRSDLSSPASAASPTPAAATKSTASSQPIYTPPPTPARQWTVGERCRALYAADGKFYEATILGVGAGGQVYSVEFKGYADSPPVTLGPQNLKPLQDHSKYHKSHSGGATGTDSSADGTGDKKRKGISESGSAGIKKKKAPGAGSEQVQKQMAWQNFAKGGAKKSKGGPILKKSIFATPDNPEGRVGVVGSGKGMTQFQQRGKHIYDQNQPNP